MGAALDEYIAAELERRWEIAEAWWLQLRPVLVSREQYVSDIVAMGGPLCYVVLGDESLIVPVHARSNATRH